MDLESSVIIATSAITAGATLVGVAVTGLIAFLTEGARSRREESRENVRDRQSEATRQREIAEGIADRFLDRIPSLRREDPDLDRHFDELFYDAWYTKLEPGFRREIGRLVDDEARERLLLIVDSIGDRVLADRSGRSALFFVEHLVVLGAEVAQALVRRQPVSSPVLVQVVALEHDANALQAHQEEQAELQREYRQEKRAEAAKSAAENKREGR